MIIVDWKHHSKYSIFTREIHLNPINCSPVLKSVGLKGLTIQRWMIPNLTKHGRFRICPPSEGQTQCSSAWRDEAWHLGLIVRSLHQLPWWWLWWWCEKWNEVLLSETRCWPSSQLWKLSILCLFCLMCVDVFAHLREKSLPGVPVPPLWLFKCVSVCLTGAR